MSLCSRSGVGLTMSCKSDSEFIVPLPTGMCTGWIRRRGLTGVLLFCGEGWTNVRMGVGGVWYKMFSVGCSGGLKVVGEFFFLLLFLGGGETNISGSTGFISVSGGFSSSGEEGVSSIRLDSISKQMPASKYTWGGLVRSSVSYSRVTEGDGSGGVFKFSSTASSSGSTVGESG